MELKEIEASIDDFYDIWRICPPFWREIWVGSLTRLLGRFGMSEQAVRVAISRIASQGWLKARKVGNRSYYSLTPRGKSG